ncbi:hypothetical protein G6F31_019883 [Rhizopus arrhizus]|nr:hypothetical protein G6F31_019883 [Rhizopus arrhizus]
MALCGTGFGLFLSPNQRFIMFSVPTHRASVASGLSGLARLLGQTMGAAFVAACFTFNTDAGATWAFASRATPGTRWRHRDPGDKADSRPAPGLDRPVKSPAAGSAPHRSAARPTAGSLVATPGAEVRLASLDSRPGVESAQWRLRRPRCAPHWTWRGTAHRAPWRD